MHAKSPSQMEDKRHAFHLMSVCPASVLKSTVFSNETGLLNIIMEQYRALVGKFCFSKFDPSDMYLNVCSYMFEVS